MVYDFFIKLFSRFTAANTVEAKKKKQMKHLTRELSHNRFSRFYKPKTKEVTGEFANFLHDIYKVVSPAQLLLQNAAKSAIFKHIVVESFFDEKTEEIKELLDSPIENWANMGDIPVICQTINDSLTVFSSAFDGSQIKAINYCYNNILTMINFISFDYYGILRKFSSEVREGNFKYVPKFSNIYGSVLVQKIKDFLEIAFTVGSNNDWEQIIKIMKVYRENVIMLGNAEWNKIIHRLHSVYNSGILEKMIRHIDEDPLWQLNAQFPNEHIAKEYLDTKQTEVKAKLDKIISHRKKNQKETLLNFIFGKTEINRTQYYTINVSELYIKKNFTGFIHAETINYLLAFLTDVFGTELKAICDALVIRGVWMVHESCLEMSECYHQLIELAGRIAAFDSKLSDSGSYGVRLNSSINNAARNNTQAKLVVSALANANDEAMELINTGIRLVFSMGNSFKALLDDYRTTTRILIRNWQELDNLDLSIGESIKNAFEKIDGFSQLILSLTGDTIEAQPVKS